MSPTSAHRPHCARDGLPAAARTLMVAVLAAGFVLAGPAQDVAAQSRPIGAKDQLQIRVDELPELPSEHLVSDDGTISLGVAGRIDVQGLTETQIEERIRSRLLDTGLRRATVSVRVTAYRSRPVTVLGAVASPGNLTVPGRSTLLDVLLAAGGLGASHGRVATVRRRADNGLSDQVEIDLEALFEQGDPDINLPIFPGDVIRVHEAETVTVLLMGEIATVGEQVFRGERATILTAIAKAGGLSETASNKITIQRLAEGDERREITVDFKRILAGKAPDVALEDGDLIVVKESFF